MDIKSASTLPTYRTQEDFSVLDGADPMSKEDTTNAAFHTSDMEGGDAKFLKAAELIGSSGPVLLAQEETYETNKETEMEAKTSKQAKEAAL